MPAQEKFDLVIRARDEATATIRKVNTEIDKLGTGSLPKVTTALGAYDRAALKADLRSAALGASIAGMPPVVSQTANAFLLLNPAVAAVAVGVGLLTSAVIDSINSNKEFFLSLEKNTGGLNALADSFGNAARAARDLLGIQDQQNTIRLQEAEAELDRINKQRAVNTLLEQQLAMSQGETVFLGDKKKRTLELTVEIEKLRRALGLMDQTLGREGPMSTLDDFSKIQAEAAKNAELLNRALRQQAGLLAGLQRENFRGLGFDRSLRGPDFFGVERQEGDSSKDAMNEFLDNQREILREQNAMIQFAQQQWQEFSAVVMSSTDQLATGITDMFFGLRDSLADVFRDMARAWVRYFINEIIKMTALRLGMALFNVIFPGSGSVLSVAGAGGGISAGGSLLDMIANPRRSPQGTGSGVDVISASANRFSRGGATGASVVVNINGPILGEEEHVRKKVIPVIENEIRYQRTNIAGR